jgi:hypothetical protein
MKVWHTLALFVGLSTAASNLLPVADSDSAVAFKKADPHRKVRRPQKYSGSTIFSAAPVPKGAPASYKTATGKVSQMHDKTKLVKLPSNMADRDDLGASIAPLQRRDVLRKLRGVNAPHAVNDFYECATTVC